MSGREKRIHERFELARLAFVRSSRDATTLGGVLGNISVNGAAVVFRIPVDDLAEIMPPDLKVDLIIDEFPALTGRVVRTEPQAVALTLDLETGAQRDLLEHILRVTENDYQITSIDDVTSETLR